MEAIMSNQTPSSLTCPSCGAPLDYDGKSSVIRCRFCKNVALIPGLPSTQEATPRASLEEVQQLAQSGNVVEAIKRYRELYGVGLKEAKDAVEALSAGKVIEVHRVYSGPLSAEETGRVLEEVQELLRTGDKINAIKHYREVNDVSLTQAKAVVDQVEAALTGIPVQPRPEITGYPTTSTPRRSRSGKFTGCLAGFLVLLIFGAILAVVLISNKASPFQPNLYVSDPAILVPSAGTQPDVAALFYNPDKDTRLIGLVDGTSGKLLWQGAPLTGDGFAQGIASSGELVYAASGNSLLAYHKSDGSLAWQTQMPDKLNYGETPIMVIAGRVTTFNADQSLQAYDAVTGSLVWNRQLAGNDRTLHLMGGSLVVLDYTEGTYDYSMYFIDPLSGNEQRVLSPICQEDEFTTSALDYDSGIIYAEAENALYFFYDSYQGCVQRIDFNSGQVIWQTIPQDNFSFSPYGFNWLTTDTTIYFDNGSQLLAVNKSDGAIQSMLSDDNYDFVPLAITGDTLIVRARRSRGTERFELCGVNTFTGKQMWQMSLQGFSPIDPPNEMAGLVDDTDFAWTWKLTPTGLTLIKFQGAPNQMLLDTINPTDGTLISEQTIALTQVSGDFYSIPEVIGWQDNVVYLNVDGVIYAMDISTGKVLFHF
jgi:large subunit ribosomal protein L7/L12